MSRLIVILVSVLWAGNAAAQSCPEINFARGAFSGEVSGQVSEPAPKCFRFAAAAGQTAHLQLTGSQRICFTVPGVIDCQSDYSFRTRQQTYEVGVYHMFAREAAAPFTLRLTIR